MTNFQFNKVLVAVLMMLWGLSPLYGARGQTGNEIVQIEWSNNDLLAVVTSDNQLKIRSASNAQFTTSIQGLIGIPSALAWSADSSKLAIGTGYYDQGLLKGYLHVWDANTASMLASSSIQEGMVISMLWKTNNSKILSGITSGEESKIYMFDLPSMQANAVGNSTTFGLIESPDGSQIAFGTYSGTIVIINAVSFDRELTATRFRHQIHPVCCTAWHPSGRYIATGHIDGLIFIWDANYGNVLYTLSGAGLVQLRADENYITSIRALKFDPTGRFLRSMNGEGIVRTFNADTGELIAEKQVNGPVNAADWNADASQVIYGTTSRDPQITTAPGEITQSGLNLAPLCSPDPAAYRTWRISNPNATRSDFGWTAGGWRPSGSGLRVGASSGGDASGRGVPQHALIGR